MRVWLLLMTRIGTGIAGGETSKLALGISTTATTRTVEADAVSQSQIRRVAWTWKTTLTTAIGLTATRAASSHLIVDMLVEEECTATRGMVLEKRWDVVNRLLDDATKSGIFVAVANVQSRITAGEATLDSFVVCDVQ